MRTTRLPTRLPGACVLVLVALATPLVLHAQDVAEEELEPHHRMGPAGIFSAKGPINTDLDGVAIHGYDVVAYFTREEAMEGSEEYEVEHRGALFRFSSEEHRDLFVEDPEAYMPEYGGYCALGMAGDYKDGMHPEAFSIVDGRLFFNLTPAIHRGWQRNRERLIEDADANWPEARDSERYGPGIGPI